MVVMKISSKATEKYPKGKTNKNTEDDETIDENALPEVIPQNRNYTEQTMSRPR